MQSRYRRAHLGTNGSELRLAAKAQKLGAVAANRGQLSRSKSLLSFLSKIERGILLMFVLAVLALSPLIFIRGVWITDAAVSYLAWPINKITKTEYPPALCDLSSRLFRWRCAGDTLIP